VGDVNNAFILCLYFRRSHSRGYWRYICAHLEKGTRQALFDPASLPADCRGSLNSSRTCRKGLASLWPVCYSRLHQISNANAG